MKKRILTLLLVCAMLLSSASLYSCSEQTDPESGSTAPAAEEETAVEEDVPEEEVTRANISDNLPEMSFDGAEYRAAQSVGNKYEFYAEELNGEGTNDSVYNRNLSVEDRFGVKIVSVDYESVSTLVNDVATLVQAGSDAYEVASHYAYKAYVPIRAGVYRSWNEVPNVDFSQPWWNGLANEQNTINGILYTATGDLNISSLLNTYASFFSVDLAAEYGITPESLYSLVYEGQWTIDKFIELTASVYEDANGNGKRDNTDTYGYAAYPGISCDAWLAAFDQPISGKDENGFPTAAFMTDKTVSILEKMNNFYYNTEGMLAEVGSAEYEVTMFVNGDVIFVPSIFNDAFTNYRYMDTAYGIVPMPKWDENQERYLTNARDQYTVLGIPTFKTDDSLTLIGVVTEALTAESYRSVYPQYYDIALKGKYSLDQDTTNMVDLVLAGRNFDFAFLFGEGEFQRLPYFFRDLMSAKDVNVASKYKKTEKALKKGLEKLATFYGG